MRDTWLRASTLCATLAAVALLNVRSLSVAQPPETWFGVVADALVIAIALTWLSMLDPSTMSRWVYRALWVGALFTAAGSAQAVIGRIGEPKPWLQTLGSGLLPLGLGSVAIGLYFWLHSSRTAYARLSESKERYERLSRTDALTGLSNSRYYYEQIELEIERAQRYRRSLSLLFLDIDDFKAYNDTYGHIAGDKVLKGLGRVIHETLRENDSAYRYGGEEFTVILPETDCKEAFVVAERIRSGFQSLRTDGQAVSGRKTVSVGVTSIREGDTAEALTKRADKAMYQAKLQGKNVSIREC